MSTTTSTITKVGVVCIPVSDQDRALAFYVDVLGLEKRADVDDEISRMGDPVPPLVWFRDPDGNTLMVVETP